MKIVIEQYGRFILDGIVVVAVMVIIFLGLSDANGNKGIFKVTGAQLEIENVDYTAYTDFKGTYKTESEKTKPKITFTGVRVATGNLVLSDYIKATDYTGASLFIQISSILSPEGDELIDGYNTETTAITLLEPGVYTIKVSATDSSSHKTESTVQFPVNMY